jgi:4a-hydroxytetrahydrobiopterin dehydratase
MRKPAPLGEAEITAALAALDGWARRGDELVRTHDAVDFPAAIRIVDEVAVLAEEADHHPDIDIRWRTVTFALCTHSAGSHITELDVSMAAGINAVIAAEAGARHGSS